MSTIGNGPSCSRKRSSTSRPYPGTKGPLRRYPLDTPLRDKELRALGCTCTALTARPDEPLQHRRAGAVIRLILEAGIRTDDLELDGGA